MHRESDEWMTHSLARILEKIAKRNLESNQGNHCETKTETTNNQLRQNNDRHIQNSQINAKIKHHPLKLRKPKECKTRGRKARVSHSQTLQQRGAASYRTLSRPDSGL